MEQLLKELIKLKFDKANYIQCLFLFYSFFIVNPPLKSDIHSIPLDKFHIVYYVQLLERNFRNNPDKVLLKNTLQNCIPPFIPYLKYILTARIKLPFRIN